MTKPSPTGRTARLSLRFTPTAAETLGDIARRERVTRGEALRRAIAHYAQCNTMSYPTREARPVPKDGGRNG